MTPASSSRPRWHQRVAAALRSGTQTGQSRDRDRHRGLDRQAALRSRIISTLHALDEPVPSAREAGAEIAAAAASLTAGGASQLWLWNVVFLAQFPTASEIDALQAELIWAGPDQIIAGLAKRNAEAKDSWALRSAAELITVPIVDVTHTSGYAGHSGVQRVVRQTVPLWAAAHPLELASYDKKAKVFRKLTPGEYDRTVNWHGFAAATDELVSDHAPFLIPWQTSVIVPEVTVSRGRTDRLLTLASHSGSELATISYDLIPLLVPELVDAPTREKFGQTTMLIRASTRTSAISASVAADVADLVQVYRNSGITGPEIAHHGLPVYAGNPGPDAVTRCEAELLTDPDLPLVISVSTIEARKNHVSTLRAAELLWREGLRFQLLFIAGNSSPEDPFWAELAKLMAAGRPVSCLRSASEEMLWCAYRLARFSVFVSLAEGFGLAAAESIAAGTPVVLTEFGSMAEVGAPGGAQFCDPRDLDSIAAAMRTLLTDGERLAELTSEALSRDGGSWDDYAAATWSWLVDGERADR